MSHVCGQMGGGRDLGVKKERSGLVRVKGGGLGRPAPKKNGRGPSCKVRRCKKNGEADDTKMIPK